jgi:hypothetical protein
MYFDVGNWGTLLRVAVLAALIILPVWYHVYKQGKRKD